MSENAYAARRLHTRELGPRSRRPAAGSPTSALALAVGCMLILAAIWSIAELVPAVHARDARALYEFTTLNRPRLESVANFLLKLLDPALFILWGTALLAVAFARRRARLGVAVLAVLGLAPLTADLLKPLLAHPHNTVGGVHVGAASWPSGHATAATALALSAVLVSPAAIRFAVGIIGAIFVLAVSGSLLMLAWHLPSDVLGGWFVAAMWMSLAVAVLRLAERLRPSRALPAPADGPPPAA